MTNEIPEIHEECLKFSKGNLEKIFFLIERIRKDIYSDDKRAQAAAMIMIHILMGMFGLNVFKDEVKTNELGTLENPLPAKKYKKAKTVYLSKEEDKEND